MGKHELSRIDCDNTPDKTIEYYKDENQRLSKSQYRTNKLLCDAQATVNDQAVSIVELQHQIRAKDQELQQCRKQISKLEAILQNRPSM